MNEIFQRSQQISAETHQDSVAKLIAQLMQRVLHGATLDTVLNSIYDNFKAFLPFNRIGCALIDKSGKSIDSRWCRSDRPILLDDTFSARLEGSSLQFVLEQQRPRILNNLEEYLNKHPNSRQTRLIVNEGLRSSFTCPLIAEGHGVGFLFFSSVDVDAYSESHSALFSEIAGVLSLGILVASQRDRSVKSHCGYLDMLNGLLRSVNPDSEHIIQLVGDVGRALIPDYIRHCRVAATLTEVGEIMSANKEQKSVAEIVSTIVELDAVSTIVSLYSQDYVLLCSQYGDLHNEPIALGANLIRTVQEFKRLESVHSSVRPAIEHLRRRPETFAPFIVDELERIVWDPVDTAVRQVTVDELVEGMVFKEHVLSSNGDILISDHHRVDTETKERLNRFVSLGNRIREPLLVICDFQDEIAPVVGFAAASQR